MRKNLSFACFLLLAVFFTMRTGAQQTTSMGFLTFSGKVVNAEAELSWETVQELTVSHFNLQRSTDGIHFSTINRTTARGSVNNADRNKYGFKDARANLLTDTGFYRLECMDNHGVPYYSKIISLQFPKAKKLTLLSSGAVTTALWFHINSSRKEKSVFLIADQNGNIVSRQALSCEKGTERKSLDTSGLPSGLYTVTVVGDDQGMTERFIKR
ncbi:MAG: type sorting protein [Flaviaesturariibacter sp.]|nr:type sorting protein [Flaviaesturariibacter sp.]